MICLPLLLDLRVYWDLILVPYSCVCSMRPLGNRGSVGITGQSL